MINLGQEPRYLVEGAHEAIIDADTFNAVQEEIERRAKTHKATTAKKTSYTYTGLIECAKCGKNYRRKTTATQIVWICSTFNTKGKKYCASKQIPEVILDAVVAQVTDDPSNINKIIADDNNTLHFHLTDGTVTTKVYADGRDDGLGEIDASSEEEFIKWLHFKDKYGHPWEVCRGGNTTHISLYVRHYDDGFKLVLSGSALTRTIETVKIYLAIRKAGYPVSLVDGHALVSRLLETERIGIVPEGVFPCYCDSLFPNEHIIDFMNLPSENRQLVAAHCVWQDIEPVELIDK